MSADNGARPRPGARIAALDSLPDHGAVAVDFRAGEQLYSLIVVRRGDLVRAYENVCPHARLPLERPDGRVAVAEGRFLVCAAHGASFRIEDGACAGGPATRALDPVAIELRDGWVLAR